VRTSIALAPLALAVVLVAGCSGEPAGTPSQGGSGPTMSPPALGGHQPSPHPVPTRPMDPLEKPVHDRLATQVAREGLTLDYLDCPHWDHAVPSRMTCRGYVDGLVARVAVHLKAAVAGKAVSFDARLLDGVIATSGLEATLRRRGWTHSDCGDVPAYPARVGSRLVCRVSRPGDQRYLVATVSDRAGAVMIADYRGVDPAS
jgi:hypothetical protein